MNIMTTRMTLATLALRVLDAQKQYFKTRSKDDLIASKKLEAELRATATATIEEIQRGD